MLGDRPRRRPVHQDVPDLTAGIALWVGYGILRSDMVIVIANSISLLLLMGILYFKMRELLGAASH
jgi:uncharacterized protein with PQ loop repeat